jgi:hypothetical protein
VHSEMFPLLRTDAPNPTELFQIWLNLPARHKMAAPHFTMFWGPDIPCVERDGVQLSVIAGVVPQAPAPLAPPPSSWASQPEGDVAIWTLKLAPGARFTLPPAGRWRNRARPCCAGTAGQHAQRVGQWQPAGRHAGVARSPHCRIGGAVRSVCHEHPGRNPTSFCRLPPHPVRWLALAQRSAGAWCCNRTFCAPPWRTHRTTGSAQFADRHAAAKQVAVAVDVVNPSHGRPVLGVRAGRLLGGANVAAIRMRPVGLHQAVGRVRRVLQRVVLSGPSSLVRALFDLADLSSRIAIIASMKRSSSSSVSLSVGSTMSVLATGKLSVGA